MSERRNLCNELDDLQQLQKDLELSYEKYFAGVDKREPQRARVELSRRLRHYTSRRIVWTDLKFRYQGLLSRFMSYCQYWDRILRLIDEGKYHRHLAQAQRPQQPATQVASPPTEGFSKEAERLHQELLKARQACGLHGAGPDVAKVASLLEAQRDKIRDRYGNRPVEFSIDISTGKPSIKVSLKK